MKYLLSIFFIVFFQGCAFTSLSTSEATRTQETYPQTIHVNKNFQTNSAQVYVKKSNGYIKQSKPNITPKTSIYSGSIKGVIQKLSYDKFKKSWLYEVQGVDESNGKLPYAKFYHYKKLANRGDLVYIILNNSQLQNLFFIKKGNKITKSKRIKHLKIKKISYKKNKRRKIPQISLPAVEHVDF